MKTKARASTGPENLSPATVPHQTAQTDHPGPDELIDRGDIDELVSHSQYIELRLLMVHLRRMREASSLSLTDLSERAGLTRAAISRLEKGWNLNPTLETLFRYAEAVGAHLKLSVDESTEAAMDGQGQI
jgi:DNA-binding XRE family transcriptional regulator